MVSVLGLLVQRERRAGFGGGGAGAGGDQGTSATPENLTGLCEGGMGGGGGGGGC